LSRASRLRLREKVSFVGGYGGEIQFKKNCGGSGGERHLTVYLRNYKLLKSEEKRITDLIRHTTKPFRLRIEFDTINPAGRNTKTPPK
jgi:hypothetical protein